ncbi:MAG: invasion associated locus B family protein, partial [Agrobacterium sp.]
MMQKANTFTRTALSALVLSLGAVSAPAISQAQDAAPAAQGAGAPPLGWFKTCSKQEDNDVCVVQNVVLAQNGQMITAVGLITVEGKVNRKLLQV